jgi:phosphoglycolate phosphatase
VTVQRMRRAGAVGFDLDLTLINSRPAIMAAWRAVAEETGVRIDPAAVDSRMGIKLEDEVEFWFPAEQAEGAAACYRRHYIQLAPKLTTLLPGAADAVAAVRAAGERAVIITAKHQVSVEPSLAAVKLDADEVFTHVHGPEKAVVLERLAAAAYVGDTPADMAAARTARVTGVGVSTGSFPASDLQAAGARVVLGSLEEFPAWYADFRKESMTDGE